LAGYALDNVASRSLTVSSLNLNAVIGVQGSDQPGDTNGSDFHSRLGSLAWEQRTEVSPFPLQGGANFSISPDPTGGSGSLLVVDNGPNDADPAPGQLAVSDVLLASYTITETGAPAGYALDNVASRSVIVSSLNLNAVVGIQGSDQPGDTDASDFHTRLGSLAWEQRTEVSPFPLQDGASFSISPDPTGGASSLIVVDNGTNDANPAPAKSR